MHRRFGRGRRGTGRGRPTTRYLQAMSTTEKTPEPYLEPTSIATSQPNVNVEEQVWMIVERETGNLSEATTPTTNENPDLGKTLMPPPPTPPVEVKSGGAHQADCPHSKWEKSPLCKDDEIRQDLMNHFMRRKSWNNPVNVSEAHRKIDEAMQKGGPLDWYLQSQRKMYNDLMEKELRSEKCTCSGMRTDDATCSFAEQPEQEQL